MSNWSIFKKSIFLKILQEDLTGIYFIPAMLNKDKSILLPSIEDNKLPWFPREFLKPMIEPELAIGDNAKYEQTVLMILLVIAMIWYIMVD